MFKPLFGGGKVVLLNIAIVSIRSLTGFGGMETVISTVMRELEANGDTVNLILRHSSKVDTAWADDLKCHIINDGGGMLKKGVYCYRLTRLLCCLQPDLVIAVQPNAIPYLRFYRYLRRSKVRIGSWLHFSLTSMQLRKLKHLDNYDFHLAISSGIANAFNERLKSETKNSYLVYNPTVSVEDTIKRPNIPNFIYIGRLIYDGQKRVNDFLYALAQTKGNWKATILGNGPDTDKLKQLACDLNIAERIEWTGWLKDPWGSVQEASALVLTSDYEGFPMVLIEALNRGLACISSDCPTGPSDIILPGQNGWLYPLRDIKALTEILQKIVDEPETSLPDQQIIKQSGQRFAIEHIIPRIRNALITEMNKIV